MIRKAIFLFFLMLLFLNVKNYAFYDTEIENELIDKDILETVANAKDMVLNSKNAILYDNTYNEILYEKNAYEKVPNASTTKILTAIVAYENGNLKDVVKVSKNAAMIGGSGINLKSGDKITLEDLIKGLLIHSGNDAAVAIAEHVGGNVDNFCKMMNDKAKEMGLTGTNFVTPHGLDRDEHYSTAFDLAKMAEYLLNIEFLANIVKEKSVTISVNNVPRLLTTTNEMLSIYDGADGVKTGFTGDAGRCLVTSVTKNKRQLISVVLGCGTKKQRTMDSIKLLNYGYENYTVVDICENMKKEFVISVEKGKKSTYKISIKGEILMPVENTKKDKITYQYELNNKLKAPLKKSENIGKIHIFAENTLLKTINIKLPKTIEKKSYFDYFSEFLKINVKNYEIKL